MKDCFLFLEKEFPKIYSNAKYCEISLVDSYYESSIIYAGICCEEIVSFICKDIFEHDELNSKYNQIEKLNELENFNVFPLEILQKLNAIRNLRNKIAHDEMIVDIVNNAEKAHYFLFDICKWFYNVYNGFNSDILIYNGPIYISEDSYIDENYNDFKSLIEDIIRNVTNETLEIKDSSYQLTQNVDDYFKEVINDFKSYENKNIDFKIQDSTIYSRGYFNKLANEIRNDPNFISVRELSQHGENDFINIVHDFDKTKEKADLIEIGKRLEKEDRQRAIEFYDSLKDNELFIHDYYPYRRQCILFKNKIKDDQKDLDTIIELFNNEIYCNPNQYIWLYNKLLELIDKLKLSDDEINNIDVLLRNYGKNEEKYFELQNNPIPIAERIFQNNGELKLLSWEKYDFVQNVYYIKELGVGYIRRREYETAISYYLNLLKSDILYYKYHAYKQLGRICEEMNNPEKFKRLYELSYL